MYSSRPASSDGDWTLRYEVALRRQQLPGQDINVNAAAAQYGMRVKQD